MGRKEGERVGVALLSLLSASLSPLVLENLKNSVEVF